MFVEIFLILILFILFHFLVNVRNTLKLLIVTILLFLSCSILLMLKGFTIISCVFILVYAGAILVMICIAFVLSPVIAESSKSKTKNELEKIYFDASTEAVQYITAGFIVALLVTIWYSTTNPMFFWDIFNELYISSNFIKRSNHYYVADNNLNEIQTYEYYFNILNYYNNYNLNFFENYYKNNFNYFIIEYFNNLKLENEQNHYIFNEIIIKELETDVKLFRKLDKLIFKGKKAYESDNYMDSQDYRIEIFSRYYLTQNKQILDMYKFEGISANSFLLHQANFNNQCGLNVFEFNFNKLDHEQLKCKVEKFNILPKEILFCNLKKSLSEEIFKNIKYIDYKILGHKNFMKDIKFYYNKILYLEILREKYNFLLKNIIENQLNFEYNNLNLKKTFNNEVFSLIDKLKFTEKFQIDNFHNKLTIKSYNDNQVFYIFKNFKYIIILVGLYLHFTLLVCLRIFTINQEVYNIKRQDSNDQILKKWKK
jgi:NADH:ubiquinone oxidoreductase subunit 6 (subunit J)